MRKKAILLAITAFLFLISKVNILSATSLTYSSKTLPTGYNNSRKTSRNEQLAYHGETQRVYLDFDTETNGTDHVYTPEERQAIKYRLEADYANLTTHFI